RRLASEESDPYGTSLSCWFPAPPGLPLPSTGAGDEYRTDTQVFQHIAGCAPQRYRCGGQRITLGPFIVVTPSCPVDTKWPTHFWSALTVAREIGLSHLSYGRADSSAYSL